MSEWFATRAGLWARAWQAMQNREVREVSFATVSPSGWPEVRTVVLRDADPVAATLTVHTDRYSDKITSLRDVPMTEIMGWLPDLRLQIRARAEVFIQTGVSVASQWNAVPDPSRQSYGTTPRPGTPLDHALEYVKPCDPAAFAVLFCRCVAVDLVHLGEAHRRAAYSRDDDWAGQWLAP